jgi:hypothetical protein
VHQGPIELMPKDYLIGPREAKNETALRAARLRQIDPRVYQRARADLRATQLAETVDNANFLPKEVRSPTHAELETLRAAPRVEEWLAAPNAFVDQYDRLLTGPRRK